MGYQSREIEPELSKWDRIKVILFLLWLPLTAGAVVILYSLLTQQ